MTSSNNEIRDALLEAINESAGLRELLATIPGRVEQTVKSFTPVLTGDTVEHVDIKSRRSELKKLTTRRAKLGEVVYDGPDQAKWATLEFGRGDSDEHGGTPEFAQTRRAAAVWAEMRL